jgi:hypothetical protein
MAAVNELRNANPRPVSTNRSVYQLVRSPLTMIASTIPSGMAQRRAILDPEYRPISQATRTMPKNTRIAFHVLCTSNSSPHHLVE